MNPAQIFMAGCVSGPILLVGLLYVFHLLRGHKQKMVEGQTSPDGRWQLYSWTDPKDDASAVQVGVRKLGAKPSYESFFSVYPNSEDRLEPYVQVVWLNNEEVLVSYENTGNVHSHSRVELKDKEGEVKLRVNLEQVQPDRPLEGPGTGNPSLPV